MSAPGGWLQQDQVKHLSVLHGEHIQVFRHVMFTPNHSKHEADDARKKGGRVKMKKRNKEA